MRMLAPAAVLLLLLAGCATPVAAPPSTPTPEPTVTAAPALACADLIPLADLQAAITTPLSVKIDEQSAPRGSTDLIFLQAGGVHCVWGGENRTDGSWDEGLDVRILTADAASIDSILAATTFPEGAVFDTIGERSALGCFSGEFWQCTALVYDGGRLVSATVSDSGATGDAIATAQSVLDTVAAAIAATSPNSPIAPEPNSFDGGEVCNDPAITADALGADPADLALVPIDLGPGILSIASTQVEHLRCTWQLAPGNAGAVAAFWITVVPGAGWQFERMQEQPDGVAGYSAGSAVPIQIEGAEGALVACGDGCWAGVLYQGSVLELYASDVYGVPEMESVAAAFMGALD